MAQTTIKGEQTQIKLEQLLDLTIGQHGYWLINHLEYIQEELEFLIRWHRGDVQSARVHLNDLDSGFVKKLYAKIDDERHFRNIAGDSQ